MAKGPNLTWIFIAIAMAIVVLTLSFTSFETFLSDNNVSTNSIFGDTSNNLTAIQGNVELLGSDTGGLSDKGLLEAIWDSTAGVVNVFIMGLSAIGKFFDMIPIVSDILTLMQTVIPGTEILVGLFTLIITVYISLSILKAKRGSSETA